MKRLAHLLIRSRREELGLSDVEVAARSGLTIYEYGDLEARDAEVFSVAYLGDLRRLCKVLDLSLFLLLGLECAFCHQTEAFVADYSLPRSQLIAKRRSASGATQEALADAVGFETTTIQQMERQDDFLEEWSFELVAELAKVLKVPLQVLLNVKCPTCGQ